MIYFKVTVDFTAKDLKAFIADYLSLTDERPTKPSFESWLRYGLVEYGKGLYAGYKVEEKHEDKAERLFQKWYSKRDR